MSEELEVLKEISKRLDNAGIQYMITGSIATNFYAEPRMTRDIDIVVDLQPEDTEKFYNLFFKDFFVDKNMIRDAIDNEGIFNIIHRANIVKADFIIKKSSEYRREEFRRKKNFLIEKNKIAIVSPEDLILSKLFWAKDSLSELQLKDVRNLLKSVNGLDIEYIEKWVSSLGVKEIYKNLPFAEPFRQEVGDKKVKE